MKYLNKSTESEIIKQAWRYATKSHRQRIRNELLREQRGFCAYTERFVTPIDALEIEHFDDRLKGKSDDSYWNWYAVHRWINQKKRPIDKFLPILTPYDVNLSDRIHYEAGGFWPINAQDIEAENLIEFLGWNDPTLAQVRENHVSRLKYMRDNFFSGNNSAFLEYIKQDPENLSYKTVLEAELDLSFD